MLDETRRFLRKVDQDLRNLDVLDLVPRLTLILLILYAGDFWYLEVPLRVLCVGALLYRPVYRSGVFWFLVTCFLFAANYEHWYSIDNHKYLMTYWAIALTCTSFLGGVPGQRRVLARNAKLLIGLCMAFAALWKVISPDYLDGRFFRFTLITDPRFASVAEVAGGLGPAEFYRNRTLARSLRVGTRDAPVVEEVELVDTPRLARVAGVLTWWTIGIEALLALAFLLPDRWPPGPRWRHGLLLLFAITTYSIATVIGFAWLLIIMAVATVPPELPRLRTLYVAVFLLMMVYTGSWATLVLPVLRWLGAI